MGRMGKGFIPVSACAPSPAGSPLARSCQDLRRDPVRPPLAQTLWQSVEGLSEDNLAGEVNWAVEEAGRRDAELSSGAVTGRTHEQVMQAARRSIGCA